MTRQRFFCGKNFRQRPRRHQFTAVNTCARTEIQNIIRRANRIRIVFYDEHRVAEIAQAFQCREQTIIITLMQTDARFIQHIKHADERRADLRGQPDALRLAAAQRAALAIQREVAEADVPQEAEAGADFLDDFIRDFLLKLRQLERGKEFIRLFHGQAADVHDGKSGDFYL